MVSIILSIRIIIISNQLTVHSWILHIFQNFNLKNIRCQGHPGKVNVHGHIVGPTSYRLTSLLFRVRQPNHFWDRAISKFDFENTWSRCSQKIRSQKFTQHPIDFDDLHVLPFHLQLFHNLMVKVMDEVKHHGQGQTSRSHSWPSIQSIHFFSFHNEILEKKINKKTKVSNRISPKFNQVRSMIGRCYRVLRWLDEWFSHYHHDHRGKVKILLLRWQCDLDPRSPTWQLKNFPCTYVYNHVQYEGN